MPRFNHIAPVLGPVGRATAPPESCVLPADKPEAIYSRLVPGQFHSHAEDKLSLLAKQMEDCDQKRNAPGRPARSPVMKSGYVYLGQFIDHDLTYDKTLLVDAHPAIEKINNYRTPRLDLDCLYGKEPSSLVSIYNPDGTFRLGHTSLPDDPDHPATRGDDDLYRDARGTPCIVDPRDDENLVVAQVHVLFQKLHNTVLQLLNRRPELAPDPRDPDTFNQARKLVTWLYQWIVVREFLPSCVRQTVLDSVWSGNFRLYKNTARSRQDPFSLPVEFTVAAFRFGHSTIQEGYDIRGYTRVDTPSLIFWTNKGGGIGAPPKRSLSLPANYVVDWRFFFGSGEPRINRGQNIDTFITEALYKLPPQTIALFRDQATLHSHNKRLGELHMALPELTLKRGAKMCLPSGERFAAHFGYPVLNPKLIPALPDDRELFDDPEFHNQTPLWYYLLREAAIEPVFEATRADQIPIQKLGPIGSQIVAEVFYRVLSADLASILHEGRSWRPPVFVFGKSKRPRPLDSMSMIVELVELGWSATSIAGNSRARN